ncbi:phage tail sheath family protein [Brevibacillus sp. M2.1A]|uniref:phage tail sheath family protein n=1 Tax=Brevibacillus sp. M2.1A TaxID=2738980 RepID=UPI00156ACEAC|nr:phage tail sheath family protein [Brevibacillus sp. M2.1A]MCC8435480.1 phage tail sheath family protein [Brevibacillus sp. M2.1A]
MAGGTWVAQNKERAGVYINFKSKQKPIGSIGERGITSLPLNLSWGPAKQIVSLDAGTDTTKLFGYALTDPQMLLIREAMKRAKTILIYRLNVGTPATATVAPLTATAKYGGSRGNDITISVGTNVDDNSKFDVKTFVSGMEIDLQTVATVQELQANDWVTFSGTGAPVSTAGAPLTGGADGTVTAQDYADYQAAIEVEDFNTIGLTVTDTTIKDVFVSFVKRQREDEGKKIQLVLENYPTADYEGVISVKNGVVLADGTTLTAAQAVAWVAGAEAGAEVNQSLTFDAYDGAVDVTPKYTNSQIIEALKDGEFLFTAYNGRALVEQDINTFTSFTVDKNKEFRKNQVIRVLDGLANDYQRIFTDYYIGKVPNNDDGRNSFKGECINLVNQYQNIGAVQNFDPQTDIEVLPGQEVDAVLVNEWIQPVNAIEKVYMSITVE